MDILNKATSYFLIFLITLYQEIFSLEHSFWGKRLGLRVCRFYPSCSQYSREAVKRFGAIKGSILAVKRVVRCHPFNPGGYDPVPKNRKTF